MYYRDESMDNTVCCGYCGNMESSELYPTGSTAGDDFTMNRCLRCGAVFLSPRPTPQQLRTAYGSSYYGQSNEKFSPPIEKILDYFRSARARKVGRFVVPPAKVLDIGCGNGRFLGHLIKRGFESYGIELPGKAAQRASEISDLRLKIGQLSADDFGSDFFDCVCLWHVFEHLTEPQQVLQIVCKILKRDGFLVMSMPNIDSLQSLIFRGKWLHLDPPRHLFYLGADILTREMKNIGFELVDIDYFSFEQAIFGIQQSLLNIFTQKRDVLFEAFKGNKDYISGYSSLNINLQKLFAFSTVPFFAILAVVESLLRRGGAMELVFKKTGGYESSK